MCWWVSKVQVQGAGRGCQWLQRRPDLLLPLPWASPGLGQWQDSHWGADRPGEVLLPPTSQGSEYALGTSMPTQLGPPASQHVPWTKPYLKATSGENGQSLIPALPITRGHSPFGQSPAHLLPRLPSVKSGDEGLQGRG